MSILGRGAVDLGTGMPMRRLILAGILMLTLFNVPYAAAAQQARLYRVGVVLLGGPHSSTLDGLRDGLRELGLAEISIAGL